MSQVLKQKVDSGLREEIKTENLILLGIKKKKTK